MPIRLEADTLHHALARLEEWDHDAAVDCRASLSWLGWDEQGPLPLRRYELMLHLWYELPTKVWGSRTDKLARAAALGTAAGDDAGHDVRAALHRAADARADRAAGRRATRAPGAS